MQKASLGKRFLAWLIDALIIGAVSFLIGLMIPAGADEPTEPITNGDTITYSQLYPYYIEHQNDALGWNYYLVYGTQTNGVFANYNYDGLMEQYKIYTNSQEYSEYQTEEMLYSSRTELVSLIIALVLFFVYYDIIGYFWSKQTVGRMALRIRVVDYDGKKPTFGTLFLRDTVGFAIINTVCCGIPAIVNIFLIAGNDKTSIGDRMSRTMMIDLSKPQTSEDLHFGSNDNYNDRYYQNNETKNEPEEVEVVDTVYGDSNNGPSKSDDVKKDSKKEDDDEIW